MCLRKICAECAYIYIYIYIVVHSLCIFCIYSYSLFVYFCLYLSRFYLLHARFIHTQVINNLSKNLSTVAHFIFFILMKKKIFINIIKHF